jgi:hypothetical protein
MRRYRGGSKPCEEDDEEGKKLDPRQFPEPNAVFYGARPSEFIKMPKCKPRAGSSFGVLRGAH